MLHHARPIQPKHIGYSHLAPTNIQMHKPNAAFERLVHNRPVHARDQEFEEGDSGSTSLRRVRRVVDVVRGDVGEVGGRGVFDYVELVDEVEENGVLLASGSGFGRTEGCLGDVLRCWRWGGDEEGERGEGEGE